MIDRKTLAADTVRRFMDDAEFASELSAAFAAASSVRLVPAPADARPPAMGLPREAPRLWADRTKDDRPNPAAFIREVYGAWLPHTLARQDLQSYDPALYTAYAQWVRPSRHPDDTVVFAPKRPPPNKLDDNEFAVRKREANSAAQARRRAGLRTSCPE